MNGSPTITELKKKPHPSRLVEGAELGGISWERGLPAPQQASQPRVPVPGNKSPLILAYKNQLGLSQWKKLQDFQAVLLKGLAHGLTQTHAL